MPPKVSAEQRTVGAWTLTTYRREGQVSGYDIAGCLPDGTPFLLPFAPEDGALVEYLMSVAPGAPKEA